MGNTPGSDKLLCQKLLSGEVEPWFTSRIARRSHRRYRDALVLASSLFSEDQRGLCGWGLCPSAVKTMLIESTELGLVVRTTPHRPPISSLH